MTDALRSTPSDPGPARLHVRSPAAWLLAVIGGTFVLREAAPVLVPLLLSILIAYALEPAVAGLIARRLPRPAAAVLVVTALSLLAGASARTVEAEAAGVLHDLPHAVAAVRHAVAAAQSPDGRPGPVDRLQHAAGALQRTATPALPARRGVRRVAVVPESLDVGKWLLARAGGVFLAAADVWIVALLTFLLLATGDLYKRKLLKLAGPRLAQRRVTLDVIRGIDRQIERYLVVRLLISAIVAAATGAGLWLVGLDHAVAWGLVAGVLNVLPYVGPVGAIALITLAAFLQFQSAGLTVAAAAVASGVAALEGNVLTPWLTSRAGQLNTVAVFVGVLFWGWVWDVWGLLLAVPLLVAIKAVADRVEGLHPIGELLGE